MGNDNQIQKAGDNSQQVQAGVVNITNNYVTGIDERRVREVCSEVAIEAIKSCTQEATEIALSRIENFTTTLIPRIEKIENDFHSFSEPSFQFLLQSAQKTAACTEREADYEMLSELLIHRVEKRADKKTTASIAKAVEIVDQVDDEALCALTVVNAINQWVPASGNISLGLKTFDDLFSSLCYMELPIGFDWVYHLDVLDAVRASSVGNFKKTEELYLERLNGYACVGIQKDSDSYKQALELLTEANIHTSILVEHELLDGFVRLPVHSKTAISQMTIVRLNASSLANFVNKVNTCDIKVLGDIWELYSKDVSLKAQVKKEFMNRWDSLESLKKLRFWWDNLPHSFTITPIGKVLAHANAQRYSKKIPEFN